MNVIKFNDALTSILRRLPFTDENQFMESVHEIINDLIEAMNIPAYKFNMGSMIKGSDGTISIVFTKKFKRYLSLEGKLSPQEVVIDNELKQFNFKAEQDDADITREISKVIKHSVEKMGYKSYNGEIGSLLKLNNKIIEVVLSDELIDFLDNNENRLISDIFVPYNPKK